MAHVCGLPSPPARILILRPHRSLLILCAAPLNLQDPGFVLQQALQVQSSPTQQRLLEQYAQHLRQQLVQAINHPQHKDKPLTGLKIAVDAGNGSGGFFASQVGWDGCSACVHTLLADLFPCCLAEHQQLTAAGFCLPTTSVAQQR